MNSRVAGSLDANVLLRFIVQDIPVQHLLVAKLLKSTSKQFVVADTAVIEAVFVLGRAYEMERADIARVLRAFMSLPHISCNRDLFDVALEQYVASPALSFEDCCLAGHALLDDATPLYTFDKKLARQTAEAELLG